MKIFNFSKTNKKKKRIFHDGASKDSLYLAVVRGITAVIGLVITKFLSSFFSLSQYGTYSQAMLIVTTITYISILGLTDAVNYFYNSTKDDQQKEKYLSTIFGIQMFSGSFSGICIIACALPIVKYFNNTDLYKVIFFAAFMPLFTNLLNMIQVLFVSIKKVKILAARNFIVALLRFLIVLVACLAIKSIQFIFALLLILQILQIVYFLLMLRKYKCSINPKKFDKTLIKKILIFSIPMALYVATTSIIRDADKYVISFFTSTETLAIYANASKQLPFDIISSSFAVVMIPILTRQISCNRLEDAKKTFSMYLESGLQINWILISGFLLVPKEMLIFLYDYKYVSGYQIFLIYLIIDMLRFANVAIILTAKGKTKTLMIISFAALVLNLVLDILLYKAIGILGPAIASLFIMICLIIVLLSFAGKELKTNILGFFNIRKTLILCGEILASLLIVYKLKIMFFDGISNDLIRIAVVYFTYMLLILPFNYKSIISKLKFLNKSE